MAWTYLLKHLHGNERDSHPSWGICSQCQIIRKMNRTLQFAHIITHGILPWASLGGLFKINENIGVMWFTRSLKWQSLWFWKLAQSEWEQVHWYLGDVGEVFLVLKVNQVYMVLKREIRNGLQRQLWNEDVCILIKWFNKVLERCDKPVSTCHHSWPCNHSTIADK